MTTFPEDFYVVAERGSDAHDLLCDAVIDDAGFLLVGGSVLYEAITWIPFGASSWRWHLRRAEHAGSA